MKNTLISLAAVAFWASAAFIRAEAGEEKPRVLCTTFPIHQITRNIAKGSDAITVDLMIPAALGCPHDYALTPQDMVKLSRADVLIINGLGMEEFLGAPVEKANANLRIVDSSAGVANIIVDEEEHEDGRHDEDDHHDDEDHHGEDDHHHDADDDHAEGEEEGHHHHGGPNPHLFSSPSMTIALIANIARALSEADPAGAALYAANADAYAATMKALVRECAELGGRLANNRIAEPHASFDYLARDIGLEIVAVMQPHGQELSAAGLREVVDSIRDRKAGAILVEPQYPRRTGETLARETGVPMILLDPVANGPDDAPLDYFETVMRDNLRILGETLGKRL